MATGRIPDPNSAPITAKGDLYTYSTVPARLAVGNNGETLVADSSQTTGLAYREDYAAGKNKIINGDFTINQRAFTSTTTNNTYTFDRWIAKTPNSSQTFTSQSFTPGTAPVAGYESTTFLQCATTAAVGAYAIILQKIEDVRTFAGQTVTVSFWAKAASGTPKVGTQLTQAFGSGGSSNVSSTVVGFTLSTSWARYSTTFSVPSITGKTIGTGSSVEISIVFQNDYEAAVGQQTATIGVWGVQVEDGSVATAFNTATGTIQGELAACQRYFQQHTIDVAYGTLSNYGTATSTTSAESVIPLKVTMRIKPATLTYANLAWNNGVAVVAITSAALAAESSTQFAYVTGTVASGLTQYRPYALSGNNNAAAYIGISAEL